MEESGLLDLRPGDTVRVRDDDGNEADYVVKKSPWLLGHGKWVVGLTGISGGYSLHRVVAVLSHANQGRLFVDQKPRVWSKLTAAGNEIRITFNEKNDPQTLALSLVDADWLAVNVGAEIRKVEAEQENPTDHNKPRCKRCGWPLRARIEDGCTQANCSERKR